MMGDHQEDAHIWPGKGLEQSGTLRVEGPGVYSKCLYGLTHPKDRAVTVATTKFN